MTALTDGLESEEIMNKIQEFDALIMVTEPDYLRLEKHYARLADNLPARRVLFIGSAKVGERV